MTYTQQTAGINEEQKAAVETEQNAVIAAGAGSGKTRVLATRYLYLILHKNTVEEILALTFTRKAAAEMRGRIYGMLAENGSPEAKAAAAFPAHGCAKRIQRFNSRSMKCRSRSL